ncbi:methyltransferase family protein [Vibrio mangrovi]|uniref:3-oxo-5-alpha-steroid 4-dehydrogenase n=1 Tax=Vibrio mangrovi TaxID=474394 RepID=A0A1Y6IP75_9VIBR|nr:DUF1295 domain-containing protein [Vibrio mangrovi]MDW6004330.1 DUF1295 domain-containing protein [Vibrio mangrovi]SMR98871.1 3-oxo-5-alpha-steroid 4-dehydrogenase [Vibrio mangrovi]
MEHIKQKPKSGGVNREYGSAVAQRLTFVGLHFLLVVLCAWLAFNDGFTTLGQLIGQQWTLTGDIRVQLLFGCVVLYWIRHTITVLYLLQRMVDWSEVFGLICFIAFFEIGLLVVGGGAFRESIIPLSSQDAFAALLLVLGSFLNTYSELQRKWWKKDPNNKGKIYTEGLFSYSMHINYFGDVVLFSGWSLLTCNYWTLLLPLAMGYSFVAMHIPALDSYLADRYGDAFSQYAAKTKKLVPFIY